MRINFALFGYEIFSINVDKDEDSLSSVLLSSLVGDAGDDDPEFESQFELPYGFSPPGGPDSE